MLWVRSVYKWITAHLYLAILKRKKDFRYRDATSTDVHFSFLPSSSSIHIYHWPSFHSCSPITTFNFVSSLTISYSFPTLLQYLPTHPFWSSIHLLVPWVYAPTPHCHHLYLLLQFSPSYSLLYNAENPCVSLYCNTSVSVTLLYFHLSTLSIESSPSLYHIWSRRLLVWYPQ